MVTKDIADNAIVFGESARLQRYLNKAEMETIQQQMAEAKRSERANALKEVKRLCKEFGFTAGMLKGALAKGRKKK